MMQDHNAFRITLLGRFQIQKPDHTYADLTAQKAQELFAFILLNPTTHCREKLAAYLWPDCDNGQSKKLLCHTVWQLKTALATPTLAPDDYLQIDTKFVSIPQTAVIWVDALEINNAAAAVRGVAGRSLTAAQYTTLQNVTALYGGDLLPGCYEDWCILERECILRHYLILLDKLLDYCESHRLYEPGFNYGEKILRHDLTREKTHRQLMRLYTFAGYRPTALRQYQKCKQILADELGVAPSQRTTALYQKIRQDQLADSPPLALPASPNNSFTQWHQIQLTLIALQRQVAAQIEKNQ